MVSVEPDRLLVCEALAELSAVDRGVLRRSYYQGWTTAQIAHDLHIPEGTVKIEAALRGASATSQTAGNGGSERTSAVVMQTGRLPERRWRRNRARVPDIVGQSARPPHTFGRKPFQNRCGGGQLRLW